MSDLYTIHLWKSIENQRNWVRRRIIRARIFALAKTGFFIVGLMTIFWWILGAIGFTELVLRALIGARMVPASDPMITIVKYPWSASFVSFCLLGFDQQVKITIKIAVHKLLKFMD